MLFSISRMTIENFRGVRKPVVLDLVRMPPGLHFVCGRNEAEPRLGSNGSGKSSIFVDSICWALTGRTARSNRPGAEIENWHVTGKPTVVELAFGLDDERHVVRRARNPNALELDGRRVEQREIDLLLPVSDAALRRSILIDQFGEMFLSLRPEVKSQIFTETLQLDAWLDAADRAGERLRDRERTLGDLERKTEGVRAAFAEAKVQFDAAARSEDEFEGEIKRALAEVRARLKTARTRFMESGAALNEARAGWGAVEDQTDAKIEADGLRAARPGLQRAAVTAAADARQAAVELDRLETSLRAYSRVGLPVCPECGQKVGEKHLNERRTALLGQVENAKKRDSQTTAAGEAAVKVLDDADRRLSDLEKSLVLLNEVQAHVSICAERNLADDRVVKQIDREIAELRERKNPYTEQCDQLNVRMKDLRTENRRLKVETDHVSREIEICRFWQRGFREIRLEQIDATLLELELTTNRHAEQLGLDGWEIGFSTERETKRGSVSHGFAVSLYPPGQKEPIPWESYSGGESQRWQLATTFGLAEVLLSRAGVTTDFEVLDEPTRYLSTEGIDDLLDCLKDRARDLGRRIFLVDHHSLDRGSFDGVISVVKTEERGIFLEDQLRGGSTTSKRRERIRL